MRGKRLRRGDMVEVRSESEIRDTLDTDGRLDGMPFMPEMARYCGKRLRIHRRADTTCVEGLGMRRLGGTLLLEGARCDGAAHDGCERQCLMFWKEAWLKPVAADASRPSVPPPADRPSDWAMSLPTRDGERYLCQSTALASATKELPAYDQLHLLRAVADGELTLLGLAGIVVRAVHNKLRGLIRLRPIGALAGASPRNAKGNLGLRPGEAVQIKSKPEITATLDPKGRNAGLSFDPDMSDLLGGRFEVAGPIRRMVHEETGRMVHLTSTVTLKNVYCRGLCSKNCPRSNPIFWREAWLERAGPAPSSPEAVKHFEAAE